MADIDVRSGLITDNAKVLDRDPRDSRKPVIDEKAAKDELSELTSWVMARCNQWRDHRRQQYEKKWDVYERLWRGFWAPEDQSRKSEKSVLVTPGLSEAVENIVAEVEEAVFGRGDSFDIKADVEDSEELRKITDDNKQKLKEDLGRSEFVPNIGEALLNAAVYGSGIGEIVMETFTLREIVSSVRSAMASMAPPAMPEPMPMPMPDPMMGGETHMMPDGTEMPGPMAPEMGSMPEMPGMMDAMMGQPASQTPMMEPMGAAQPVAPRELTVTEKEVTYSCLQSVNPRNFLIDPNARTIDKALGCAVEEYVGAHIVRAGQKNGTYRRVEVGTSAGETQLLADPQVESEYVFDKVLLLRYYGLVPKHLLPKDAAEGEFVELFPKNEGEVVGAALREAESVAEEVISPLPGAENKKDGEKSVDPIDAEMVEAIVVIANGSVCLKANETPYVMKDRPVVAFPWDVVPGRFWGRGVCEKGLVPQKVMDAELRARIDALAYVSAPMMAMDASRLPRGFQLTVKPGKSILTNGDPKTILNPMHFGQLDQSTFQHSAQLDQMIQRATGSLDVIALAQKSGEARPGAVSMMLSGIVKRHKRTLMGFIERFYVPALRKIMWRNMQFYPERYTPMNWTFVASSVMGILQREYETQQIVQLLQTVEPTSKEYKVLLMGVVANTGLKNRIELIDMLKKSIDTAQKVDENSAAQAVDPMQQQLQQLGIQLQIEETQAKIAELRARTRLQDAKAQNEVMEPQLRQMEFATKGIYEVQADQQDRAIKNRLAIADRVLKREDIASNERIASMQSRASVASESVKARATERAAAASAPKTEVKPVPVPVPVRVSTPFRAPFPGRGARLMG